MYSLRSHNNQQQNQQQNLNNNQVLLFVYPYRTSPEGCLSL